MEDVENYFKAGVEDTSKRIRQTNLPPIYFQHAGMFVSLACSNPSGFSLVTSQKITFPHPSQPTPTLPISAGTSL